ncbi:hypothetical protein D3C72_2115690 [compost metagenome]
MKAYSRGMEPLLVCQTAWLTAVPAAERPSGGPEERRASALMAWLSPAFRLGSTAGGVGARGGFGALGRAEAGKDDGESCVRIVSPFGRGP